MARYQLTEDGVLDTDDRIGIPEDIANRHWRQYLEWIAQGNTPDPMPPPPPPLTDDDHIRNFMLSTNVHSRIVLSILRAIPGNAQLPDQAIEALIKAGMR